jgi:pimeloyl-ACP methyl ester carboxylesterase
MSRISQLKASLTQFPDIDAPSWWLLAAEQRSIWEFWSGVTMYPALKRLAPRGDGHPVLVLPGFAASDISTALLRRFLDELGYVSYPWGIGRNRGVKDEVPVRMLQRLNEISAEHPGQKVSLVGQSLGGVFARQLAKAAPKQVRQVITLGSPFTGHPLASTAAYVYEWLSGDNFDNVDFDQHLEVRIKPPVPTTSIYSKTDGVVAWQCSIEADEANQAENIHLRGGSHIGMASSPVALYLIAERLAQAEGQWKPFEPNGMLTKVFYGANDHREAA